ncbi:MAG TPA: hypothetical protein VNN17_00250 [Terriglobia bacterium]|nr:hypothetical protein [Terriglobia bacterium]
MTEPAMTQPVPIRLAYRYPNGCLLTYSARAIAYDARSIQVLTNEEFEPGLTVSVLAPFLEGLTTARVQSVVKSRKNPGYCEMVLLLGEVRKAASAAEIDKGDGRMGGAGSLAGAESGDRSARPLPELVAEAAEKLAYELRKLPPRGMAHVLAEIPPDLRSLSLVVAIAATLRLLEEKKHLVARQLLRRPEGLATEQNRP